jgi:hypothetical protein
VEVLRTYMEENNMLKLYSVLEEIKNLLSIEELNITFKIIEDSNNFNTSFFFYEKNNNIIFSGEEKELELEKSENLRKELSSLLFYYFNSNSNSNSNFNSFLLKVFKNKIIKINMETINIEEYNQVDDVVIVGFNEYGYKFKEGTYMDKIFKEKFSNLK